MTQQTTQQTSQNNRPVKGLLGAKLGMTQVWDENNRLVPVTVVQAGPCAVSQVRSAGTDGYDAVQIAFGAIDPRKVNKPMTGHFAKAGVTPRRFLVEIRTPDAAEHELGQELTVGQFEAGQSVDVVGRTKGKGTAGVMKRHGFKGLSSSHGTQRKHRSPGSIGACATPGRVFKGVRMAGRMGFERQTTQNLTVHAVDTERGLLVPVIRDAGDLNIAGLARKITDLADRTRTNKLSPDELSGGTFTVTNTGSRGALFDTPIINQPQVAILGTGAVVKRPVVVQDDTGADVIAIRSMVYLALTYDHRLVDGADAARFLSAIKTRLEDAAFEAELGA